MVQSNILKSASVTTQGLPNSAAEPARELCVSTVAAELAASDSAALSTTLDGGAPASGSGPGQRGEGLQLQVPR